LPLPLPLPLLPLPLLPLPFAFPLLSFPFPFPLPLPLLPPPVAATTVDALEPATMEPALLPLWPELPVACDPESPELQTVALLLAFLVRPAVDVEPRARPCVTLWKFSFISPSEDEIRVTPCLAGTPPPCRCGVSAADTGLPGANRPARGTGTRSTAEGRGLPCSIGLKVPDPPSVRPGLPWANAVARWPGITCAI